MKKPVKKPTRTAKKTPSAKSKSKSKSKSKRSAQTAAKPKARPAARARPTRIALGPAGGAKSGPAKPVTSAQFVSGATGPARRAAVRQLPAGSKYGPRADLHAPIDGFFTKQPPELRAILDELRALIEKIAPDAASSIKWGMPFFTRDGNMMCALAAHRAHVSLILVGSPEGYADQDPDGRLEGTGKGGRHLKLKSLADLPRAQVARWLQTAARIAHSKG
jgi:hypothetical protein